jgi:transketolase
MNGDLPDAWPVIKQELMQQSLNMPASVATRVASQYCLEFLVPKFPELLGGSADLTPSNNTKTSHSHAISPISPGNYIHYGVREFGMAAIMNGISAHQGFIPYGGTFLVFSDYARNAIRMSAMMDLKTIFILTHDSIALGEDGPTHQPIEHLAMLRYTPKLNVWRPASTLEMCVAWAHALEYQGSSCLILSRQNLPPLAQEVLEYSQIEKGGYIVFESDSNPDIILIATGSELGLAVEAAKIMVNSGTSTRVVSMPCPELFLQQTKEYQQMILPDSIRNRVAIEAASKGYWYRFVGLDGAVVGLSEFGLSAPEATVKKALGIDTESILNTCHQIINNQKVVPCN